MYENCDGLFVHVSVEKHRIKVVATTLILRE